MKTTAPTEKVKRFVIYTRCSTDEQAVGDFTTLDAQAHHCKNMLDAFGYQLAPFGKKGIINDDGYSGKDLKRPGIQAILNDINKKKSFDGVVFFRLDRLTRNPRDLYAMIDLFRANNVDFVSVRENLDSSTAIGRVVIGILGLLSAFERELTGERVKAAAIARVRQGKWVGGMLPYGYKLINDGDPLPNGRQPHKVVIDDNIAHKLKIIWEMAADNRSLTEIALRLEETGIRTQQGHMWRKQAVSNILKNPFYKGDIVYAGENNKGNHDAIIDGLLWEKANKIQKAKLPGHKFTMKPKEYKYLLSGILKCGNCGSHLMCTSSRGHTKKRFSYYICSRAKQGLGCKNKAISATMFDKAVLDYFKRASLNQDIIVEAIGSAILESNDLLKDIEKQISTVEERLSTLRKQTQQLIDLAITKGIADGLTYKAKMTELETEITRLEDKLGKLQADKSVTQITAHSGQFLHQNLRFAMQHIDLAPDDAQKGLIRALIKEIQMFDDKILIKMFVDQYIADTIPPHVRDALTAPVLLNAKNPAGISSDGALKTDDEGSPHRPHWLPGRISHRTALWSGMRLKTQRTGRNAINFTPTGSRFAISGARSALGPSINPNYSFENAS